MDRVMMRLHYLLLGMTRQTMAPFLLEATKLRCAADYVAFYFLFPLAQTSVYSNIIFCEVSWGEKQFGHPHCNLIRRLCWMQQTPRVTVLSILETPDICLISSPFYLHSSLMTPSPLFFILSTILTQGLYWLPFPLALPTTACLTSFLILLNPLTFSLPSNSLALSCLPSETSLLCPRNETKQTETPWLSWPRSNQPVPFLPLSTQFLLSTHGFHFCIIHSLYSGSTSSAPVKLHSPGMSTWSLCSWPSNSKRFSFFEYQDFSNQSSHFCSLYSWHPTPRNPTYTQAFDCSIPTSQGTHKQLCLPETMPPFRTLSSWAAAGGDWISGRGRAWFLPSPAPLDIPVLQSTAHPTVTPLPSDHHIAPSWQLIHSVYLGFCVFSRGLIIHFNYLLNISTWFSYHHLQRKDNE